MNNIEYDKNKFIFDFISNEGSFYLGKDIDFGFKNNKSKILLERDITLYSIDEITFEDKAPRKEALENVISALQIEGINFVYLIHGDKSGVKFYFGISKDLNLDEDCHLEQSIYDLGRYVLKPSLSGNFRGSKISEVSPEKKENILENIYNMNQCCYLEGVPGITEDNEKFQSVDRLIDVMLGDEFNIMILAKPLLNEDISCIEKGLYHFYNELVPLTKKSVQNSNSFNNGKSEAVTKSNGNSNSENFSNTCQTSNGSSFSTSKSFGESDTDTKNKSITKTNTSKESSEGGTEGTTLSKSKNKGESESKSTNESSSNSESKGTAKTITTNESFNIGTSSGEGSSQSKTVDFVNKEIQAWISYLDDVIFKRLDYGKGKGIFISSIVLFSDSKGSLIKLENTIKALYSGESGNRVPLRRFNVKKNDYLYNALINFQIPCLKFNKYIIDDEIFARAGLSQFVNKDNAYIGNWLSTNELSLIAGLPQKEIVGLSLREEVEFGLNFHNDFSENQKINLGHLVQSGNVLFNQKVDIDKSNLDKHTFITGVTGSGKTTTCQRILKESNLPFMVIEPAKTEYRSLIYNYDDLLIFTLGRETVAPFRLNPFEFFPNEAITSRVDLIKASIEASFDMEAAIPQIIESAIYSCYEDCGWNISTNTNSNYENPFADGIYAFPTLSDLVNKIEMVVEKHGFDERLKKDYIGSIKSRLEGLLVGAKGNMLNTKRSIDFQDIIEHHVVIELEEVRSSAQKSLIMGFILINLMEAIKEKYRKLGSFRHITLIEEAHRLLSAYSYGDNLNKKQSVETFSDMLAEVRKYGESLIIVDQIPSKLTSEVLKNTNTKIVHKIFAQDDKEAIGNTMVLNDEQKKFLSNLDVGRAVVFTQGWQKAIQVQVDKLTNLSNDYLIDDKFLRTRVLEYYRQNYKRGIFPILSFWKNKPSIEEVDKYILIQYEGLFMKFFQEYKRFFNEFKYEELKLVVLEIEKIIDKEIFIKYLFETLYKNMDEEKTMDFLEEFICDLCNDFKKRKKINYYNKLSI